MKEYQYQLKVSDAERSLIPMCVDDSRYGRLKIAMSSNYESGQSHRIDDTNYV